MVGDNRRPSIFADYAHKLREEHDRENASLSPSVPPAAKDRIITSFGQPIPEAADVELHSQRETPPETKLAPPPAPHASADEDAHRFKLPYSWFEANIWQLVSDDIRLYAVIDGSHCPGVYGRLLNSGLSWTHLYQGEAAINNVQGGPFLVTLKQDNAFSRWLIESGWGEGWGIYLTASTKAAREFYRPAGGHLAQESKERGAFVKLQSLTVEDDDPIVLIRRHFRHFTRVEFEDDGRIVVFRFYDPAVLRAYLMSCNQLELSSFFGPVVHFLCEGYCEVESLNRPQDVYGFMARPDAEGKRVFSGRCSNLVERKTVSLQQFQASQGKLERQAGPYTVIRTAQREVFQAIQREQFTEKVALRVSQMSLMHNQKLSSATARDFANRQVETATNYGLSSEKEVMAFATCAVIYGEGFERKHPEARRLLAPPEGGRPVWDVGEELNELARLGLMSKSKEMAHG